MEQSRKPATEVLIVGAGPTGLMMACQFAVHQVSFRIIDKKTDSSSNSGALIVQARTLEIFQQLGIASEAINKGIVADEIDILYDAKRIAGTSIKNIGDTLTQFPCLLMLEQSETEKLLLKFLNDRGHSLEKGVIFKSFVQGKNKISTDVFMPDGSAQTIESDFIIGADGSNSAIRNFLNIPFEGKTYPKPIFILDCSANTEIRSGAISIAFTKKSVAGFFPLRNKRWRVDGSFPKSIKTSDRISLETIINGNQGLNTLNFKIQDTDWFSVSHSQQRYARTIRVGNCFLAGDSAHVHTPVGAQGMNTGIQDAHNLAWKLALVLKQRAKPELLDSYSSERLGVSKGFARYSDVVFKMVTSTNPAVRLFRTSILKIFFLKMFPKLANKEESRLKFFKSISQIDIRYKSDFPKEKDDKKKFFNGSPKPGYRFPYFDYIYNHNQTNTHEILDSKSFTILVLAQELTPEIKSISEKYNLKMVLINKLSETEKLYSTLGIRFSGYYLIRPDAYIALRSATMNSSQLSRYLANNYLP
jgi:2-polyprenyl-6-methoxyphenol hydroxylase-like FAD-dependent oxidoreductase